MNDRDDIPGFNRRTVLKSAAVAAVGVGAFSGTASANVPDQLNFCGCTQVCVCGSEGGNYQVILAKEPYGEDDFTVVDTVDRGDRFCYELSEAQLDEGYKVVGVREGRGGDKPVNRTKVCVGPDNPQTIHFNPGTCAQKALDVLMDGFCGGSPELNFSNDGIEIVQGRCGEPCRDIPGKGSPGGGRGQGRGRDRGQ
jgi:hypothetical protein